MTGSRAAISTAIGTPPMASPRVCACWSSTISLDARELMKILLVGCGAAVEATCGAREGFDAFLRERPSLVVSDIEMPGEDGRWLMRQIRTLPPAAGGDTPIMAVTAS